MKKLIYEGKYNGDESSLPSQEHPEGSVPFREPDIDKLAVIGTIMALFVAVAAEGLLILHSREYFELSSLWTTAAIFGSLVSLVPHEFLHAVCFREEVHMYSNLSKGMMFVVGTEHMSKTRFIVMSLCPNVVFGLIPYVIALIFPNLVYLGVFGGLCIAMGCGDYINIWNAATQMPKGAKTYLSGTHSYWYNA